MASPLETTQVGGEEIDPEVGSGYGSGSDGPSGDEDSGKEGGAGLNAFTDIQASQELASEGEDDAPQQEKEESGPEPEPEPERESKQSPSDEEGVGAGAEDSASPVKSKKKKGKKKRKKPTPTEDAEPVKRSKTDAVEPASTSIAPPTQPQEPVATVDAANADTDAKMQPASGGSKDEKRPVEDVDAVKQEPQDEPGENAVTFAPVDLGDLKLVPLTEAQKADELDPSGSGYLEPGGWDLQGACDPNVQIAKMTGSYKNTLDPKRLYITYKPPKGQDPEGYELKDHFGNRKASAWLPIMLVTASYMGPQGNRDSEMRMKLQRSDNDSSKEKISKTISFRAIPIVTNSMHGHEVGRLTNPWATDCFGLHKSVIMDLLIDFATDHPLAMDAIKAPIKEKFKLDEEERVLAETALMEKKKARGEEIKKEDFVGELSKVKYSAQERILVRKAVAENVRPHVSFRKDPNTDKPLDRRAGITATIPQFWKVKYHDPKPGDDPNAPKVPVIPLGDAFDDAEGDDAITSGYKRRVRAAFHHLGVQMTHIPVRMMGTNEELPMGHDNVPAGSLVSVRVEYDITSQTDGTKPGIRYNLKEVLHTGVVLPQAQAQAAPVFAMPAIPQALQIQADSNLELSKISALDFLPKSITDTSSFPGSSSKGLLEHSAGAVGKPVD